MRLPNGRVKVGIALILTLTLYILYKRAANGAPMVPVEPPGESLAARTLLEDWHRPYNGDTPLLAMFTTFKNKADRFTIHSNVLHNWAQYKPVIQPILYAYQTDERLTTMATSLGWLVFPTPRLSKNGVPFFKDMYFHAQQQVDSVFYGYFNGDLLFDDGLVDTLLLVERFLDQLHDTMIVGMRSNFPMRGEQLYNKTEVARVARTKSKLFRPDAEDYFVIAHNSFPWESLTDIVIGRPAYDNYLVAKAIMKGVSVVDATKTLLALHQSGVDGDYAGFKNKDQDFNSKAIGAFNYGRGHTTGSQYFTQYRSGHIELWRRSPAKQMVANPRPTPVATTIITTLVANITTNSTSQVMSNGTIAASQDISRNLTMDRRDSAIRPNDTHIHLNVTSNSSLLSNLTLDTSVKANVTNSTTAL